MMGPHWTALAAVCSKSTTYIHCSHLPLVLPQFPPKGAFSPTPDTPREESVPISMLLDLMAVNCGREHIWPLLLSFYAGGMKMTFTYSLYRAVEEIDQAAYISCFL